MAAELAQRSAGAGGASTCGRPLRHDPAAHRGRRPDDLRLLGGRPAGGRRPDGVLPTGGGTRIGDDSPARRSRSSPTRVPPPRVHAVRQHLVQQRDRERLRQRAPLGRTDWIRNGTLSALLQNRFSAQLTGQPVTPYVDNLVVEVDGATGSTQDLVAGVERGLLVTCLWYIREVDPQTLLLTGLTRDGVYLVASGASPSSTR